MTVTAEPPPRVVLPLPRPIETVPVKFTVTDTGAICLAPKQYENLSKTMAETTRWIKEARARLDWYATEGDQPAP